LKSLIRKTFRGQTDIETGFRPIRSVDVEKTVDDWMKINKSKQECSQLCRNCQRDSDTVSDGYVINTNIQ